METSDLPIIIESETSNLPRAKDFQTTTSTSSGGFRGIKNFSKLIILIFGVVIVGEIIFGIRTLTSPAKTVGKVQPITGGKIFLSSPNQTFKVGDPVPVNLRIDTGGNNINGVDVVINYNPGFMTITRQSIETQGVFTDFPLLEVDDKNGVVRISGIASVNQPGFSGIGTLAKLNFTAKAATSQTKMMVNFTPGLTTESNIIEAGSSQDILDGVTDLNLTINQ